MYALSEQIINWDLGIIAFFCLPPEPPTITSHPQEMKDAVPGNPVTFTVQATGTDPLTYKWQWKSAEEDGGSEEWQPRDVESTSLTIPSVHKYNEGSYCCVVSNIAGTQTSEAAKLSIGESSCLHVYIESNLQSTFCSTCSQTSQNH